MDVLQCNKYIDKFIINYCYKNKYSNFKIILLNLLNMYNNEEFCIYYKKMLIKRLYKYNFDYDKINKEIILLENLGSIDSKLTIIKKDLQKSYLFNTNFNNIYNSSFNSNSNYNIVIGTNNIFPLKSNSISLNGEFKELYEQFTNNLKRSYLSKCENKNRNIKLCDSYSSVNIDFNINDKLYTIIASLELANILYLFNEKDSIDINNYNNNYLYLYYPFH